MSAAAILGAATLLAMVILIASILARPAHDRCWRCDAERAPDLRNATNGYHDGRRWTCNSCTAWVLREEARMFSGDKARDLRRFAEMYEHAAQLMNGRR